MDAHRPYGKGRPNRSLRNARWHDSKRTYESPLISPLSMNVRSFCVAEERALSNAAFLNSSMFASASDSSSRSGSPVFRRSPINLRICEAISAGWCRNASRIYGHVNLGIRLRIAPIEIAGSMSRMKFNSASYLFFQLALGFGGVLNFGCGEEAVARYVNYNVITNSGRLGTIQGGDFKALRAAFSSHFLSPFSMPA